MKEATRSRVIVFAHVALVVLSIGLYRWAKHAQAAGAALALAQTQTGEGKIQVALLLDTSDSMSGLIDQARSQLWKVVTRLDAARRAGKRARLEIALYEYGNPGRSTERAGWIRQVAPFSADLDRVSEALFSLHTNGGAEYVGQVVRDATSQLQWSSDARDLKLVFVAGNESFTQGPVPPAQAIAQARKKGIVVNVILCGGDDPTWREGARLAGTDFLVIDQNQAVVHLAAPQDDEIARLGVALNATYVAYGDEGRLGLERQAAQDKNAANAQAGSAVWRSQAKSSASYSNARWDLVDAVREGKVAVDELRAEDLPEEMRHMTPAERTAHVQKQRNERGRLQKRIRELSAARDAFVAAERGKLAGKDAKSLDTAMLAATQAQATAAGFRFE
jgi:von Willebrand factor type A domain-containing protein